MVAFAATGWRPLGEEKGSLACMEGMEADDSDVSEEILDSFRAR